MFQSTLLNCSKLLHLCEGHVAGPSQAWRSLWILQDLALASQRLQGSRPLAVKQTNAKMEVRLYQWVNNTFWYIIILSPALSPSNPLIIHCFSLSESHCPNPPSSQCRAISTGSPSCCFSERTGRLETMDLMAELNQIQMVKKCMKRSSENPARNATPLHSLHV